MAFADEIEGSEVCVGDTICVIGNGATIFHNLVVTDVFEDRIRANHVDSVGLQSRTDTTFALLDSYWKFYLVERPKQPLPTHFGAKVEVEGEKYVLATADDTYPWIAESGGWYTTEEMSEKDWKEA